MRENIRQQKIPDPKYSYKEKVKVIKGFFKGYYGEVLVYNEDTNQYEVNIKQEKETTNLVTVTEDQIQPVKKWFWEWM